MEFIDQAFTKFMQTAPQLSPLILNFSEVTDQMGEGENTDLQIGVFTLMGGNDSAFVPVVCKAGTFYPIDSIFLDSTKSFQPLTPKTTAQLAGTLGKAKGGLGSTTKIPQGVQQNPDLTSLIVPPRTGKYAYASESRIAEFLAVLPNHLKQFTFEKISSEKSVYDALDKSFGLKAIFSVLRDTSEASGQAAAAPQNTTGTGPSIIQKTQISVITTPREIQDLGDQLAATNFIRDGYHVHGNVINPRVAIPATDLKQNTFQEVNAQSFPNSTYKAQMVSGGEKLAYLPKYSEINAKIMRNSFASIFEDGTYIRHNFVAAGDGESGQMGMSAVFDNTPPILLKDCSPDLEILLFTASGEAIGPVKVQSVVLTNSGVELKISSYSPINQIVGLKDFKFEADIVGNTLYVPYNIIVLPLKGIADEALFEKNVNVANKRNDMLVANLLGSELNLAHDGVEFSINNHPVGGMPLAMKALVEKQAMDPDVAKSFLKKASEEKFVKIFLSKQAGVGSVTPTDIPNYGETLSPQDKVGLNGSFMPNLQNAVSLQDNQSTEATIISQLLQVPDMSEYIEEYLPEIDQAVDRLGRILFVLRVNSDKLSSDVDSDSMFSMIAKIRTVYRQLGDSLCALRENVALAVPSASSESVKGAKVK